MSFEIVAVFLWVSAIVPIFCPQQGVPRCVSPTGGCTGESDRLVGFATGFGAPDSEATE